MYKNQLDDLRIKLKLVYKNYGTYPYDKDDIKLKFIKTSKSHSFKKDTIVTFKGIEYSNILIEFNNEIHRINYTDLVVYNPDMDGIVLDVIEQRIAVGDWIAFAENYAYNPVLDIGVIKKIHDNNSLEVNVRTKNGWSKNIKRVQSGKLCIMNAYYLQGIDLFISEMSHYYENKGVDAFIKLFLSNINNFAKKALNHMTSDFLVRLTDENKRKISKRISALYLALKHDPSHILDMETLST